MVGVLKTMNQSNSNLATALILEDDDGSSGDFPVRNLSLVVIDFLSFGGFLLPTNQRLFSFGERTLGVDRHRSTRNKHLLNKGGIAQR